MIWFAAGHAPNSQPQPAQSPTAIATESSPIDRQLLDRYWRRLSHDRLRTGGLVLENVDVNRVGSNAELWEKVARKLRTGQMPPAGRPRPDAHVVGAFVSTLEAALDRASAAFPIRAGPSRTA